MADDGLGMIEFAGISGWTVLALAVGSAAALAALHLLRIRPRRLRVVTTLFYRPAAERTIARRLPGRFRHPWTYALLTLICLLLVVALGQPQWRSQRGDATARIVVLDGGMSMAAASDETSRWDEALAAVRREAVRGDSRHATVIVADPWPRLLHGLDESPLLLPRRLAAVRPASVPAERAAAVRLAQNLVADAQEAEIVLISDRPLDAAPEPPTDANGAQGAGGGRLASNVTLRTVEVGSAGDNAGLLAAVFETPADDPLRGRLIVRVGYWGTAPREVALTAAAARAGAPAGVALGRDVRVMQPDSTADFAFDGLVADGSTVRVELEPGDALPADDRVDVTLPYRPPIRVWLDAAVPPALRAMVSSTPGVRIVENGAGARGVGIVVAPLLTEPLRPMLLLGGEGPALDSSVPVRVARENPLVRDLAFDGVSCGGGAALELQEGEAGCLFAGDACLAAIGEAGGHRRIRMSPALVVEDSAAGRHPALAAFIVRSLRHLAHWTAPVAIDVEHMVRDPLWPRRAGVDRLVAMPGARDASALREATVTAATADAGGWSWSASPFEYLLVGALVVLLLEGVLHARGRMP